MRVLLITRDHQLASHISSLASDSAGNTFEIESVDRASEAAQRLKQNVGIDAVVMDWVLAAFRSVEALQLLMETAPELPIIIVGDDPNLLQQMSLIEHGAQDYLNRHRLNADSLLRVVRSAIARK